MNKAPLVSIIIPTFNREKFISETLISLLSQTYTNWECIIVDDGSTDNTISVIESYCKKDDRFRLFKRDRKPKGAPTCRNIGIKESKGDYINFFDSDDIMHPEMLNKKVMPFIVNPKLNFTVCQTAHFSDNFDFQNISKYNILYPKLKDKYTLESFTIGDITFYTPGPLWKKSFLLKQDIYFREYQKVIQEWEFYIRLLLKDDKNYEAIDEPLVFYRSHNESITSQLIDRDEEVIISFWETRLHIFELLKKNGKLTEKIHNFYLVEAKSLIRSLALRRKLKLFLRIQKSYFNLNKKPNLFLYFISIISYFVFKKGDSFFKHV